MGLPISVGTGLTTRTVLFIRGLLCFRQSVLWQIVRSVRCKIVVVFVSKGITWCLMAL